MHKWSPFGSKHHDGLDMNSQASNFIQPVQLDFSSKPTDAFMAQFDSIADGPLDENGYSHVGGVNISLGKVGDTVMVEQASMADITNMNNSVFCVHHTGSASSSVYVGTKSETSVL